jgi:hypothetical protein
LLRDFEQATHQSVEPTRLKEDRLRQFAALVAVKKEADVTTRSGS